MLTELMTDAGVLRSGVPICGMGGIATWKDAAEFLLLGASAVQVCTAVMHYGYRIVEDMIDGLSNWMDDKGFATIYDFCRQISAAGQHLRRARSELSGGRPHRSGQVHPVQPVLRGLQRHRPPVHRPLLARTA